MTEREPCPQTIATLDKLDETTWFEFVGRKEFQSVVEVSSWADAVKCATSLLSENFQNERANDLREMIAAKNKSRFKQWNYIVRAIKPFVVALVQEKTNDAVVKYNLSKEVVSAIRWDILLLCMECEYADVVDPGYFHATAFYYTKGHFPCGVVEYQGGFKRVVF